MNNLKTVESIKNSNSFSNDRENINIQMIESYIQQGTESRPNDVIFDESIIIDRTEEEKNLQELMEEFENQTKKEFIFKKTSSIGNTPVAENSEIKKPDRISLKNMAKNLDTSFHESIGDFNIKKVTENSEERSLKEPGPIEVISLSGSLFNSIENLKKKPEHVKIEESMDYLNVNDLSRITNPKNNIIKRVIDKKMPPKITFTYRPVKPKVTFTYNLNHIDKRNIKI